MDGLYSGEQLNTLNPTAYLAVYVGNATTEEGLKALFDQHQDAQDFLAAAGLTHEIVRYLLTTECNPDEGWGEPEELIDYNTRPDGSQSVKEEICLWERRPLDGVSGEVEIADCKLHPLQPGYPEQVFFRYPMDEYGSTNTPRTPGTQKPTLGFEILYVEEGDGVATFFTGLEDNNPDQTETVKLYPGMLLIIRAGVPRKVRTDTGSIMEFRITSNLEWSYPGPEQNTMATVRDPIDRVISYNAITDSDDSQ